MITIALYEVLLYNYTQKTVIALRPQNLVFYGYDCHTDGLAERFVMKTNLQVTRLTDKELGELHRRVDELKRRISEGTLKFPFVIDGLQSVIEGGDKRAPDYYDGATPELKVWKTVSTGLHISPAHYKESIQSAGISILMDAARVIDKIALVGKGQHDLVLLSVGKMGFPNGATLNRILGKAQDFGLELCPAEVALALRLEYLDQPDQEQIRVGMKPDTSDTEEWYEMILDIRGGNVNHVPLAVGGYPTQQRYAYPPSSLFFFVKPSSHN